MINVTIGIIVRRVDIVGIEVEKAIPFHQHGHYFDFARLLVIVGAGAGAGA